jgi:hypothetical protein
MNFTFTFAFMYFTINSLLNVCVQFAGRQRQMLLHNTAANHSTLYSTVLAGQQNKENTSLRCHGNNGYVNAPAVFGSADITCLI